MLIIKRNNLEYYVCSECEKWFEDAEGEVEITDRNSVIIPATGTEEPPAPGDDSDLYLVIALSAAAVLGFVLVHTKKKRVPF